MVELLELQLSGNHLATLQLQYTSTYLRLVVDGSHPLPESCRVN